MKKLFIIISATLFGCGYAGINVPSYSTINEIRKYDSNHSKYFGKGTFEFFIIGSNNFMFIDTTGKFNIGDTIQMIKY